MSHWGRGKLYQHQELLEFHLTQLLLGQIGLFPRQDWTRGSLRSLQTLASGVFKTSWNIFLKHLGWLQIRKCNTTTIIFPTVGSFYGKTQRTALSNILHIKNTCHTLWHGNQRSTELRGSRPPSRKAISSGSTSPLVPLQNCLDLAVETPSIIKLFASQVTCTSLSHKPQSQTENILPVIKSIKQETDDGEEEGGHQKIFGYVALPLWEEFSTPLPELVSGWVGTHAHLSIYIRHSCKGNKIIYLPEQEHTWQSLLQQNHFKPMKFDRDAGCSQRSTLVLQALSQKW